MSLAVDAAEARYRQVEASFESAVKQVKAQGVANEQLDALLSRMQTDLKHSLLRAQASEMGTPQRLEERLVILQRSFDAVLELLAHGSEHLIDFVAAALHQRLERQGPFLERGADRGDELLELRSSFLQQRSKLSRSLVEQVEQWLDESDELAGCSLCDSLRC